VPAWDYCYVADSIERAEGGGLVREFFIARPDRAETRRDITENVLLALLGDEGWELVSVLSVQTQYSESPADIGGIPSGSARRGSSNTSGTMYYFKRPRATGL
jgi:hypothetical protein